MRTYLIHGDQITVRTSTQWGDQFSGLLPAQQRGILLRLLARVNVTSDALEIVVRPGRLPAVLEGSVCPIRSASDEPTIALTLATQLRRCGYGIRFVVKSERS